MITWLSQKIQSFLQKWLPFLGDSIQKIDSEFFSEALQRPVRLSLFVYQKKFGSPPMSLLLLNDGQDAPALGLEKTLTQLYLQQQIPPTLVVAIHAGDRMQEYGTASQPDYAQRGAKAFAYSHFVVKELLPYLSQQFSLTNDPAKTALAGFSLGGLSAFDIVWNHPHIFHRVGVFSGALWWRSTPFDPQNPDANRIIHHQVTEGKHHPGLRFWLQTGTDDEKEDRNNNGIIDAIDDTLDLIKALKGLGYIEGTDIKYVEVQGGQHHPPTWGKIMPDFLKWLQN